MKNQPRKKHQHLLQNIDNQIIRLQSVQNYTQFFLQNGRTEIMSYTLKNYQDMLSLPFLRVNKSCIINLDYFQHICTENKRIRMKDGSEIQISRRRFEEVCKNISIH